MGACSPNPGGGYEHLGEKKSYSANSGGVVVGVPAPAPASGMPVAQYAKPIA